MRKLIAGLALALAAPLAMPTESTSAQEAASEAATAQRPNVLVWMMDDVGFAQVGAYGGLVETPNIDRVAERGLQYTNYHTAPICSAARASFLTGRMPHSVNIGGHATAARDFPGYNGRIPASAGTIAANLKQAGYATFAVGKWDHLPNSDASPAGPFKYWPTGQGFEKFYGFLAADTDLWHPTIIDGVRPVAAPDQEDYIFTRDMADRAIAMIEARHGTDPQRPFFTYWATGEAHSPHHAPQRWIDHYRGRFDMGWDAAREEVLKNQVDRGLLPAGTAMAPRPEGMPAWDDLSPEAQRLYARQMEAFAASLSHADEQFGRVLDALESSGELDNTIIIVVADNGASAEGGPNGLFNEAAVTAGRPPSIADNMRFYYRWGGPETFPHYAYGWAVAGNTPLRYFKQVTHEGGSRVPLVISWPEGISARGELRRQFAHVSDIAPTILDATGVPLAEIINDVKQSPMEGASIANGFAADIDPREGRAQYVELYGNKGLWQGGWSINTTHRFKTWDWNTAATFDEPWELYDIVTDPGQTTDLAAAQPDRVAAMAALFDEQVARYNVEPIHNLRDTAAEAFAEARKDFMRRGGKWRYPGPVGNIQNSLAPPINMTGFEMTATVRPSTYGVTGPVFAYGGQLGGIALYLDEGHPTFIVSEVDGEAREYVRSDHAIGAVSLPLGVTVDRGPTGEDGRAELHVTITSGPEVLAERSFRFAVPRYFGLPETFGIGVDSGSPVLASAGQDARFDGEISNVLFDHSKWGPGGATIH